MDVKIKKIHPDAKVPVYGSKGAACFDLYAARIIDTADDIERTVTYGTGLQFEVPEGHVMMIIPVEQVDFEEVDELSDTERGEGGFGSTGVK